MIVVQVEEIVMVILKLIFVLEEVELVEIEIVEMLTVAILMLQE